MDNFNIGDGVYDMQESGLTDIFTVVAVNSDETVVVDYGDYGYHTVETKHLELAYTAGYEDRVMRVAREELENMSFEEYNSLPEYNRK